MIGGIIDSVFNVLTDRRDYNRQVSQYKDQYQLQKEQFYNPMQHRVADLKKAGLHPTLAAGMTSGQVVSAPQHSPSGKQTNFAGIQFQKAQLDQIQAQTELLKAQAEDIRTNTPIAGQVSTAPDGESLGVKALLARPPLEKRPIAATTDAPRVQYGTERIIELAPGFFYKVSQGVPAEVLEQEYGEIAKELYGLYKTFKDAGININDKQQIGIWLHKRLKGSGQKIRSKSFKQWQKSPSDIPDW